MTDTTHDIAALVAFLRGSGHIDGVWFGDRHPTEKGAFWWRSHLHPITALQAERDAALSKVDFYEQKDGMGGAVVHAIREILNAHNVPKAAFIDDHVANALVQRDAWKARAEAAEARVAELEAIRASDAQFTNTQMKRAEAAEENVGILQASREALEAQVAHLQRDMSKAHSLGPRSKAEALAALKGNNNDRL